MGKIAFLYEKEENKDLFAVCKELLEQAGHEVRFYQYNDENVDYLFKTHVEQIDLLICSNLTAYDVRTLAGGRSMSLAEYKVYHLITRKRCKNEKYLKDVISIAHLFFCIEEQNMERLKETYPHIPYLGLLSEWGKDVKKNGAVLYDSICEVLKMCYID